MKQFIDKLIERLEEESRDSQENMVKSTSNSVANFCSGACGAYNKTIAIVNQLAEEYSSKSSSLETDLAIVQSLPSLYPLQPFEEEAVRRVVGRAKSSNIQTIDISELLGESENDGWISVEDRLPEEKENPITHDYMQYPVMVNISGTLDVRYYYFGNGHWRLGFQIMDEYVTHWMDIAPYQPKGE